MAVIVGAILWRLEALVILFLLFSILGLVEFYQLIDKHDIKPQKIYGIIAGVIFFFLFFPGIISSDLPLLPVILVSLFGTSFIVELFRKSDKPFLNVATTFLGIFYVVIPFSLLIYIVRVLFFTEAVISTPFSVANATSSYKYFLLGYFLLIWSNDTFAYLIGKTIGKHKLFERISPQKTWEGFVGGLVVTQVIAFIISIYFTELAFIHWLVIGLIISVFGTLGDLVESMFKRSLGVKDSGEILPGHGGILDRFDGMLLSSSFVVTYLIFIK